MNGVIISNKKICNRNRFSIRLVLGTEFGDDQKLSELIFKPSTELDDRVIGIDVCLSKDILLIEKKHEENTGQYELNQPRRNYRHVLKNNHQGSSDGKFDLLKSQVAILDVLLQNYLFHPFLLPVYSESVLGYWWLRSYCLNCLSWVSKVDKVSKLDRT